MSQLRSEIWHFCSGEKYVTFLSEGKKRAVLFTVLAGWKEVSAGKEDTPRAAGVVFSSP